MEQPDLQKRLLLALVLSLLVFIFYDMFVSQNTQKQSDANKSVYSAPTTTQAVANNTTVATTSPNAPSTTTKAISTIKSNDFVMSIDEIGRISQVTLLQSKYKGEDGKALNLLNPLSVKPLEVRFSDQKLNDEALKVPYTASTDTIDLNSNETKLILTQKLSSTTVTKELSFYKDGHYDLKIKSSTPNDFFITSGQRPNPADEVADMAVNGALIGKSDGTFETLEDGDMDTAQSYSGIDFISSFDKYYASILYDFDKKLNVSTTILAEDNPLVFVQSKGELTLHGYIGSKDYKVLHNLNPKLTGAIEYGFFTFIAKPLFWLLNEIHSVVGNWGWAIVIITLLVKLVLFLPSYKGMLSMLKLKDLAPKMQEIREKYKDDMQKMNMHTMDLYKKHGANPLGGCLPILLQIPIFFAIYRVLVNAVELQGAEWILWIEDLSKLDPYFILPVLMGITMWYQQKISPNSFTDPMQQKIFQWLPVIMTVFFIYFPAGLVLYWFVSNLFTIAQQYAVNISYANHKALEIEKHKKGK